MSAGRFVYRVQVVLSSGGRAGQEVFLQEGRAVHAWKWWFKFSSAQIPRDRVMVQKLDLSIRFFYWSQNLLWPNVFQGYLKGLDLRRIIDLVIPVFRNRIIICQAFAGARRAASRTVSPPAWIHCVSGIQICSVDNNSTHTSPWFVFRWLTSYHSNFLYNTHKLIYINPFIFAHSIARFDWREENSKMGETS